jgi:hypothetical protein
MDSSLRDGLMAAFERISDDNYIDWYLAFKLIRANIGFSRDQALDDALVKALFALDVRNTATCANCIGLLRDAEPGPRKKQVKWLP